MSMGFPHCWQVEINLPAASNTVQQFTFKDQPQIRYARVLAIETYTYADAFNTQPSQYPLINGTQLSQLCLVLETGDPEGKKDDRTAQGRFTQTQQNIKYLPLTSLHRIQNSAGDPFVRQLMMFDSLFVTWDKSYIQTKNGGLLNPTDVGCCFMVYYSWLTKDGKPIDRN